MNMVNAQPDVTQGRKPRLLTRLGDRHLAAILKYNSEGVLGVS